MRVVAGLALLLCACGPTSRQIGQAVLWAAPIITVAVLGFAWLYAWLWRPLREAPVRIDLRPALVVAAIQLALAITTLWAPDLDGELIGIAVWTVGTSYLALQVILLRIALLAPGRVYSWALLAPWLLFYPGAPILGLLSTGGHEDLGDAFAMLWILPGYAGWVTGPLVLIAIVEVVLRRVARSRRMRPPPPTLPTARVHF